jgi:hypothetical protein
LFQMHPSLKMLTFYQKMMYAPRITVNFMFVYFGIATMVRLLYYCFSYCLWLLYIIHKSSELHVVEKVNVEVVLKTDILIVIN